MMRLIFLIAILNSCGKIPQVHYSRSQIKFDSANIFSSKSQTLCFGSAKIVECFSNQKSKYIELNEEVISVVTGKEKSCALTGKSIFCWQNLDANPVKIDIPNPIMLSGGKSHFCAIDQTKVVYCWGDNSNGQIGLPPSEKSEGLNRIESLKDKAVSIHSGYFHNCIVDRLNKAWCWGDNRSGQLGNGSSTSTHIPKMIDNLRSVKYLAAGLSHTCALSQETNEVLCWGSNKLNQLGQLNLESSPTPLTVPLGEIEPAKLYSGASHSCVIDKMQKVWCWGWNLFGQISQNKDNHHQVEQLKLAEPAKILITSQYFSVAIDSKGQGSIFGETFGLGSSLEESLTNFGDIVSLR